MPVNGDRLVYCIVLAAALLVVILVAFGCTTQPSCVDNPRNMRCMTADQLEKELNQ